MLRNFFQDRRGSALPVVALSLVGLMGASGAAIDMGRAQLVQAKLSSALDAAGLAAGASVSTVNLNAEAAKYVSANYPTNYLGSTLGAVTVTANNDSSVLTLHASATVPTTFMKVLGISNVQVKADSEITRTSKGLELVMVLDNTGSMSGSKLTGLKTAAKDLVNILYGGKATVPNLWIGLVPFAQAVNIGTSRVGWTKTNSFHWGESEWMGCVDARYATGRDVTDDPPATEKFEQYYWKCDTDTDNNGNTINAWYGSDSGHDNCKLRSSTQYQDTSVALGPNKFCSQEVTPMTANKNTIISAIDAMNAVGNTHVNLGAVWGWRMLSPRWQGLWGGEMPATLPLAYKTQLMNKAVIIMTDGDNTMSSTVRTAYGYLDEGNLGSTSSGTAEAALDTKLGQVCTALKDSTRGVLVYTIAFGNPGNTIKNMLKNCATTPDYFFDSPSNAALQTAFKQIGDSLANLRVSK